MGYESNFLRFELLRERKKIWGKNLFHLENKYLCYLGLYRIICNYLGLSATIKGLSWTIWDYLELSGSIWDYVRLCETI